ncbi:hypothetical protein HMPREF0971_02280 [Segatella oris F0302]|uniref:Uncharacterized protein n=1 Tax=Segatella oris F0302 TaxID=649760 RepID=D1QTF2_9BACT|nr:hypothetical protein HMPREF0971_02280 [Segatella oris F0302]
MNKESSMMQSLHIAFLLIFLREKRGLVTEVNRKGKAKISSLKGNFLEMISLFVGVSFPICVKSPCHMKQMAYCYDAEHALI